MIYVGIDLHRKRSQLTALAEDGSELLSRKVANEPEALTAIFAELGDEASVALEATFGWEWLAELLEAEGHELHLAHPLRTRAIAAARVKTNAIDARTLAHLLRTDLLPQAYVAPRELRDLRSLLRHRVALTHMRSALKNRVHAVLAAHGLQRPYQRLFGPNGRRFLAQLELREPPRRRLDSLLRLVDDFDREIELVRREIDTLAEHDPRVDVLTQLKGIGPYTALLVIAEAGDVDRFPSARHFCSYAG
jgi:transposase